MRIRDWSSDVCSSDLHAWLRAHAMFARSYGQIILQGDQRTASRIQKLNITTVLDAARRPGSRNLCVIASRPQEVWMVMRGSKRAILIHDHPTLHHHRRLADDTLRMAVLGRSCHGPAK